VICDMRAPVPAGKIKCGTDGVQADVCNHVFNVKCSKRF
jgi:hypothetical protein